MKFAKLVQISKHQKELAPNLQKIKGKSYEKDSKIFSNSCNISCN